MVVVGLGVVCVSGGSGSEVLDSQAGDGDRRAKAERQRQAASLEPVTATWAAIAFTRIFSQLTITSTIARLPPTTANRLRSGRYHLDSIDPTTNACIYIRGRNIDDDESISCTQ